jgi:uncharacterized membrane protein
MTDFLSCCYLLSISSLIQFKNSLLLTFKLYCDERNIIQVCLLNVTIPLYFITTDIDTVRSLLDNNQIPYDKILLKPQKQYLLNSTEFCTSADLVKIKILPSEIEKVLKLTSIPLLNHTSTCLDYFLMKKVKKDGWFELSNLKPLPSTYSKFFKSSLVDSIFIVDSLADIAPTIPVIEFECSIFALSIDVENELYHTCSHSDTSSVALSCARVDELIEYLHVRKCDILVVFNIAKLKKESPFFNRFLYRYSISTHSKPNSDGRVICDLEAIHRTLTNSKERKYTIPFLATNHLDMTNCQPADEPLCLLQLFAKFEMLKFVKTISMIAGVPIGRIYGVDTLDVQDWLLLHRFGEVKCIPPPKITNAASVGLNNGGFSLSPVPGVHDGLTMEFDFAAFYPSIVAESSCPHEKLICYDQQAGSIFPPLMLSLIRLRKQWENEGVPRIQIVSLKLLTNKMYGRCDYPRSLFYNPTLGALISERGRAILKMTIDTAREMLPGTVIYGMTDSLFVFFETKELSTMHQLAARFCEAINTQFTYINLQPKEIFTRIILYAQKNRYLARAQTYDPTLEAFTNLKTIVKNRDTDEKGCPPLFKTLFLRFIEDILLNFGTLDDDAFTNFCAYFESIIDGLRLGSVDPALLVFTKELSKSPAAYRAELNKKPPPYLFLAKETDGARSTVDFVLLQGGVVGSLAQLQDNPALVDAEVYIKKFLLPFALRLTDLPEFQTFRSYFSNYISASAPTTPSPSNSTKRTFAPTIITENLELKMRLAHLQHRKPLTVQCNECEGHCSFYGLMEAERILIEFMFHQSQNLGELEQALNFFFETEGINCADFSCFYSNPLSSNDFKAILIDNTQLTDPAIKINFNIDIFHSLGSTIEIRNLLKKLLVKFSIAKKIKFDI